MGSLAFWAQKKTAATDQTSAVMNFNLWSQCDEKGNSFLDIGFVVSNIWASSFLHFYIPFGTEADITDLSSIIKDANVIGAIFNEKYSVTDLPDTPSFWPVRDEAKKQPAFVIYSWSGHPDTAVSIRKDSSIPGAFIDIDVQKIEKQLETLSTASTLKNGDFYFRFRINIPSPEGEDAIVRKYTPANTFLQSTFATTYIIDFRFNDNRSLPVSVSNAIIQKGNDFVGVSKLHFLLMTKAHVDVETGAEGVSIRELERDIWDGYIGERFNSKDIVAYHTAKKSETKQWEFFAKLKVNNSTTQVVLTYLVALGVITTIFNVFSTWICKLLGLS